MPVEPHERYTEEEKYQRRIDTAEWDPPAMTEEERLTKRRFEAYFAFEMNHPPVKRSRLGEFGQGTIDHE